MITEGIARPPPTRFTPHEGDTLPKNMKEPMSRKARQMLKLVQEREFQTIRECAMELIKLTHHIDADRREIGFDYGFIHDAVLRNSRP